MPIVVIFQTHPPDIIWALKSTHLCFRFEDLGFGAWGRGAKLLCLGCRVGGQG